MPSGEEAAPLPASGKISPLPLQERLGADHAKNQLLLSLSITSILLPGDDEGHLRF